jgi:hypothetical protein
MQPESLLLSIINERNLEEEWNDYLWNQILKRFRFPSPIIHSVRVVPPVPFQ